MIKNKIKSFLSILAVLTFGFAMTASAGNMNWTANQIVELSSPDIDFTIVSGSDANSLIVSAGSMSVVVANGEVFTFTSASREVEITGASTAEITNSCSSGTATITVTGGAGGEAITFTPTSSQCGTSSNGGSGGGGSKKKTVPATPATPAVPGVSPAVPATPATPGMGYAFGTTLVKQGVRGENCRAWQMFFNAKRNAGLATDGICGPKSIAAAKAWQAANGLVADGLLGPMSRAKAAMTP